MLKSLKIKNFTLIDLIELEYSPGLNIIIGETGAGKSIIVDALMLALGERASADLVRQGEAKSIIEATFELNINHPANKLLKENELDADNDTIITRREILAKGNSRCFINDTPVQLSVLKQFGDYLVDFHGQHDHQMLLRPETHIDILDSISNINSLKENYLNIFNRQKNLISRLEEFKAKKNSFDEKFDSYTQEFSELIKSNPKENEDTELDNELNIIENSETLFNLTGELYAILSEDEHSTYNSLLKSKKILEQLIDIDDSFKEFFQEFNTSLISIGEISKFTSDYKSNIQFDEARIEQIRERLIILKRLKKKYGTIIDAISRKHFLEKELRLIENFDEEIGKIKEALLDNKIELGFTALEISEKRKEVSTMISEKTIELLKEMGIENGTFLVKISTQPITRNPSISNMKSNSEFKIQNSELISQVTAIIENIEYLAYNNGIDLVEFLISTNKGEAPKPLANVASGGEISRVMLAIKSILAKNENLPVLIFDEIDTGISGRIAQRVGKVMKNLSSNHQIISITHLAQIAALGDRNIVVKKNEEMEKTVIKAKILDDSEKIFEIAKLISGEEISEAALDSVRELSK